MAKEVEAKKPKKKLIRVRIAPALAKLSPYKPSIGSGSLYFSLAGPQSLEKDGLRIRHQISSFVTCREELCEMPRNFLNDSSSFIAKDKEDYLDLEKFRLLMASSGNTDSRKRGLFSAKRVLNILEEKAGWEKSIITSVVYEPISECDSWLLTGDKRWTMSPQMISLATLILRLGWKGRGFSAENLEDVLKEFTKIAKGSQDNDNRYMKACHQYIVPLMANVEKVFSGDLKQYFPKSGEGGWRGRGGVYTFFSEYSGNEALDKRLTKYVK